MNILIVDDSREKIADIIRALTSKCEVNRSNISTAGSVIEAKRELRDNDFDLLILDVLIPVRVEDEPSAEASLSLLNDIDAGHRIRKPKFIVGLTAFEETRAVVEDHFKDRLWTILYYDPTSEDWLTSIGNSVSYLKSHSQQPTVNSYDVDLCVLTALADPEEAAVTKLPWNWEPAEPLDASLFFRKGTIKLEEANYSVVLAHAPRMGMVSTALTSAKLIAKFKPKFIFMAGICAANRGKANVGDVIVADPSWDYQSGKRVRESETTSFEIDPHQISLPGFVRAHMDQLITDHHLFSDIKNQWEGNKPETELKLHVGPVASGSAVLNDQQIMLEIKEQNRKLLGVEMEVYGMYAAAHSASSPRPTPIAIKSVCDFGDGTKNDAYQKYAAYTSAQTLKHFVERYLPAIHEEAGRS